MPEKRAVFNFFTRKTEIKVVPKKCNCGNVGYVGSGKVGPDMSLHPCQL
jgi:hypothetical protein